MDSKEEILFKKPTVLREESNDKIGPNVAIEEVSEGVSEKGDKVESVSTTILPQSMTQLCPPNGHYFIDQLKNGVIIEHKMVVKSRIVFGRAQDCDIIMSHPSVSRYHAVLLWSPISDEDFQSGKNSESFWYLVDCGSTHGTNCNKNQIIAGKMIKLLPNNNVFKFGASTRLFTLGSTLEDRDPDEDNTEERYSRLKSKPNPKTKDVDIGCNWGINEEEIEDNIEETADSKSLQAIIAAMKSTGSEGLQTDNSNAYSSNPNKCIQQWFEREGYELEFKCDSMHNKFKCTLDLPIDGQWIPVEGSLLHKKKEAISDVCLKCCQLLDRAQLLFPWQQKTQTLRKKQSEDIDSDSDMIDETVMPSKKKVRLNSESNDNSNVDNFETLNKKWSEMNEELCKLRIKLANIGLQKDEKPSTEQLSEDSLDNFMASISQKKYGLSISEKIEKSNLKMKINLLVKEQQKLEKLIKLAKPSLDFQSVPKQNEINTDLSLNSPNLRPNKSENLSQSIETNKQNIEKSDSKHREEEIKKKTEDIINELKNNSKQQKSSSTLKSVKQRIKAQSIVEAIEKEKQLEKTKQKVGYDSDYVDWLPPTDQSGDGKTALNEKLGY